MKFTFMVSLDVPDTTEESWDQESYGYRPTKTAVKDYIKSAVHYWGKQNHPTDPFFNIDKITVKNPPKE